MRWQIYNFGTDELIPVHFEDAKEARRLCGPREQQCVVSIPTTDEDMMYFAGDEMWCDHVLHPRDCIYCNPDYAEAFLATCVDCCPTGNTWHRPDPETGGVECLACKSVRPADDPEFADGPEFDGWEDRSCS